MKRITIILEIISIFLKKILLNIYFYANILMLLSIYYLYRGIVLMVAHRSPKPPVRVRILLPLPYFISLLFFSRCFYLQNFFKIFYSFTIFIIIFICIFFIPYFSSGYNSNSNISGEIIDFNPNGFVWPLPRIY